MRPKHIPTPEKMWELFDGYRTWCKSTPRYSYSLSTKTGEATAIPLERPLTQVGFRTYAADKECSVQDYFANTDSRYSEYRTVCTHIKKEIRNDQITGGMVGQFNPSITQCLNALKEHTDVTSGDEKISAITVTIVK